MPVYDLACFHLHILGRRADVLFRHPCLLQSLETFSSLWSQLWHSWPLYSPKSSHFSLSGDNSPLVFFLALRPLFLFFSLLCWFFFLLPRYWMLLSFQLSCSFPQLYRSPWLSPNLLAWTPKFSLQVLPLVWPSYLSTRHRLPTDPWTAPAGKPKASQTQYM